MVVQAGDLFVQPHFRRTKKTDVNSYRIGVIFLSFCGASPLPDKKSGSAS